MLPTVKVEPTAAGTHFCLPNSVLNLPSAELQHVVLSVIVKQPSLLKAASQDPMLASRELPQVP
jgi:hypothetical protein